MSLRRREFIATLGSGAAAYPLAACTQQDARVRALQMRLLRLQAEATANRINWFIWEMESQIGWTTQLPWSAGTLDQRRFDGLRLLRQVPAITTISQLDASGKEQLLVSRLAKDIVGSGTDYSEDPKFTKAMAHHVYYGPVYLRRQSDPYMTLSLAGTRQGAGVSVAEIILKLVWDVVSQIKIGEHGQTYILDGQGRVIAHSDLFTYERDADGRAVRDAKGRVVAHLDMSLFQRDFSNLAHVQAARAAAAGDGSGAAQITRDINGHDVLVAYAKVGGLDWLIFVEVPVEDADVPGTDIDCGAPGRCSTTSATRAFSTPSATPNCRRIGSAISGATKRVTDSSSDFFRAPATP